MSSVIDLSAFSLEFVQQLLYQNNIYIALETCTLDLKAAWYQLVLTHEI